MSKLPRLKINWQEGSQSDETYELDRVKELIFDQGPGVLVFVEGQLINSHEELVQLVAQERYQNREWLWVFLVPRTIGGG